MLQIEITERVSGEVKATIILKFQGQERQDRSVPTSRGTKEI